MIRYLLTLAVLATALTAGARTARPSRAELQQQAVEAMAAADSLRRLSDTQSVLIDSLQQLLDRSETLLAARNAANRTPEAELTPEQRAEDSVATLRLRLERKQIESTFDTNGLVAREAAACELASVLVRGSCSAEDITDGRNGFLSEENADSMAALLAKRCHDPEVLKRVCRQAQEEIYISWDEAVYRAQQRYAAVIAAYRSGHSEPRRSLAEEYYETLAACAAALNRSRAHLRDNWNTIAEHFQ